MDSQLHETQKTHWSLKYCELLGKYTWWLNWAEHIRIQETLQKMLVIVKIVRNCCLLVRCVLSVNYVWTLKQFKHWGECRSCKKTSTFNYIYTLYRKLWCIVFMIRNQCNRSLSCPIFEQKQWSCLTNSWHLSEYLNKIVHKIVDTSLICGTTQSNAFTIWKLDPPHCWLDIWQIIRRWSKGGL